jgi:hypothetical protein
VPTNTDTVELFDACIALPVALKCELVEALLDSLEAGIESRKEIDQLWANEVKARLEAFKRGELHAEPAETALVALKQRHAKNEIENAKGGTTRSGEDMG